ncbi:hypothetical protein [Sphingomonas xinjiangensis]|uniref:Uncharacterized protein n=1 Tax=Sphingomonas xinjiangensis TaxID=643568 RepID=A0A840Y6P9_9SPHN|nr:hypothetical protein [Sphingomonas xinjiangensis]MBB5708957.1 hypothetical protein [Sphingomonas xinjiangensis]
MDLLLLLTALFASLTGIGSGDARARQVQGIAVVQASKAAQAVAQRAEAVQPTAGIAQSLTPLGQRWAVSRTPAPVSASQRFERRLE